MSLSLFDEQQPFLAQVKIDSGVGLTLQIVVNGIGNKSRVDGLYARNYDGIDHNVVVYLGRGGTSLVLGTVNVPSILITAAGPPVDLLAALGLTAQAGLVLGPTDQLTVGVSVAVVTGAVTFSAIGGTL